MNIFNKKEKTYGPGFEIGKNETFKDWLKKCEKKLNILLKKCGMIGFYLIFHADRLHQIYSDRGVFIKEVRRWSPHFHIIGIGTMPKSNEFYENEGFTYTSQKPIKFNTPDIIESLIPKIAYRLNHCAFSFTYEGRQTRAYKSYGVLANNMGKTYRERKYSQIVVNENKSPYVAKRMNHLLISGTPKHIRTERNKIFCQIVVDYKRTGYINGVLKYKHKRLANMRYANRGLRFKKGWENEECEIITSEYIKGDDKKIYLREVEHLKDVQLKGYPRHIISSNELIKDRKVHYRLIDHFNEINDNHVVSHEVAEKVRLRAAEIKEQKANGTYYPAEYNYHEDIGKWGVQSEHT